MDLVNFVLLLLAVVVLWLAIFVGRPAIARARFSRDISAIRDEVADAILSGEIQDSVAAEGFMNRATQVADSPRDFTMSYGIALLLSAKEAGVDIERVGTPIRYEGLPAADVKYLERKDLEVVTVLARHFVNGSSAWMVLAPLRAVVVALAGLFGPGVSVGTIGSVSQIARETWDVDVRPGRHRTA